MATLIVAAVVSLAWCALAIWLGPRIGYLDRPDDPTLKAHEQPAVPLGGVGIFLGVHLAALIRGDLDLAVLLATSLVLVLGLVDDRRGLPPVARLGVEVVAAVVLVVGTASPGSGVLFMALGVALVVFAINAINLFDGLDGLAGSVALVTAVGLAALASGRGLDVMEPLELAAALGGFLVFNWQPARVFLGDAGAYVLGVLLAHLILDSTDGGVVEVVFTSGVLGVFAIDLFVTLVRRRLNDRPLFIGDRSHIYDQLRDRGLGVKTVALLASGAQALLLALLVATDRLLGPWQGVLTLAIVLVAVVALLVRHGFLRVDPA